MNIGLIGSGGREHALCKKISESNLINKIFCIPGNAGTAKMATNIEANILNFNQIVKIVKDNHIDLVVVGPEEPLVQGIVDFLKKKKIKVFGPNKFAAKLEGSKSFMKKICFKNNIPTANFKICKNLIHVKEFLEKTKFPVVVKADGLAAGKGVTICKNREQVINSTIQIFKGKFKSSKKVILEEYLEGEEASYFLIVDKNSFKFLGSAQDHKRVFEKDKGPNTGGMGAYSPAPIIDKNLEKKIITRIVKPTLRAVKKEKNFYSGFLYVGLMIRNHEPYLIEYNIRMGDPECQVILPRLKTDLLNLMIKTTENKLKNLKIKWRKEKSMTIVLCTKGYPGKYKKNVRIKNLDKVKLMKSDFIYHAGTKVKNNQIFSTGGRVLNITSTGRGYLKIRKKIISLIKKINWKQGFYRKDIGWKVINKNASN